MASATLAAGVTVTTLAVLSLPGTDNGRPDRASATPPSGAALPSPPATNPTAPGPAPQAQDAKPPSGKRGDGKEAAVVPEQGSGRLRTAPAAPTAARSPTAWTDPVTYVVQVEEGLPFTPEGVATVVDEVLSEKRGWAARGHVLRRAIDITEAEVHVIVASPALTDELCAPLETGGRLSCRNGPNVVINGWRWANGAPAYAAEGIGTYRRYVVNHEVGHALGYPHASCPEPGELAPVMVQQTKGLYGCRANPWPAPAGLP